jgi:nucleotide-binding universal stress UspA family protein
VSTSTPIVPLDGGDTDVRAGSGPTPDEPPAREVVVGVDGSECALGAVRWAVQEAVRRGAPLRIVHAAPYLGRRGPTGSPPPELPRARRITAQAYTVAVHTNHDVRAFTEVVPDDPVTTLLRAAADGQLMVLGSSTTGAADEMVLASVALRVAARSPQPLVVVPRQRGNASANRPVMAVLGVGEPEDDDPVATFAAGSALRSGARLSLLQTRPARRPAAGTWTADESEWEKRFPGLEIDRTDLPGATASQVLRAVSPTPLVALSSGHGTMLHRTLDGPHRWLLRHCTAPMGLVPPAQRAEVERREEATALT